MACRFGFVLFIDQTTPIVVFRLSFSSSTSSCLRDGWFVSPFVRLFISRFLEEMDFDLLGYD